jgi:hypothetical protein
MLCFAFLTCAQLLAYMLAQVAGHTPIISDGWGARGQFDLVDLTHLKDENDGFCYLANYFDHGTKFYDNRALKSRTSFAISACLIDMLTLIGPPAILQLDNAKEMNDQASKDNGEGDEWLTDEAGCRA